MILTLLYQQIISERIFYNDFSIGGGLSRHFFDE